MTIALIRHGQTDWNLANRVQGHTDIPLNDVGRAQALETAKQINVDEWKAITSSPLSRARETATIIAEHLGLPLLDSNADLIEQHYGEAEGKEVEILRERWPDRIIPGGEHPADVTNRGLKALADLYDLGPGILAVTHGAFIRRIIATVTNCEYYDVPGIENAKKTKITKVNGSWKVLTVNNEPLEKPAPSPMITMVSASGETCSIDGIC